VLLHLIGQTPKVHEADRQNSSRENIWFRLEKDTVTSGECSRPATSFTSAHAPRIFPRRIHRIQTPTSDRVRPPSVAKPERSPPIVEQKSTSSQTHEHECASSGEGAMAGASCQQTAAVLRLQSDLRAIKTEPPDVSFHPPRAHRRARFVARGGRAPLPHNPRS